LLVKIKIVMTLTKLLRGIWHRVGLIFGDEIYVRVEYFIVFGKRLRLKNPQTYSEKLQWLKLHEGDPIYTRMVDKAEAKKYVTEIIGEEYIIPTYGVWNHFDEIDFDKLPDQFVLKTTHDSGGVIICKDKKTLDKNAAKVKLEKSLKNDYYYTSKEWPYKNVVPRIIAEKYMEDESGELCDYKLFCFDGKMKALFIATDRFTSGEETKFDFFDENFNHLPFTNGHPNATKPIKKPESFQQMKDLAEKLSQKIPHVRVDFYCTNGKIYFGELTFFHWGGFKRFEPEEWDFKFGEWFKL
ncbi:ATP-grasp fold amidoligase family protein, partial [Bacteroides thetaiotaomicron]